MKKMRSFTTRSLLSGGEIISDGRFIKEIVKFG